MNIEALTRLAQEATPGPWEYEPGEPDDPARRSWPGIYVPAKRGPGCMSFAVTTFNAEADAAYIAAASPDVVLALVRVVLAALNALADLDR